MMTIVYRGITCFFIKIVYFISRSYISNSDHLVQRQKYFWYPYGNIDMIFKITDWVVLRLSIDHVHQTLQGSQNSSSVHLVTLHFREINLITISSLQRMKNKHLKNHNFCHFNQSQMEEKDSKGQELSNYQFQHKVVLNSLSENWYFI